MVLGWGLGLVFWFRFKEFRVVLGWGLGLVFRFRFREFWVVLGWGLVVLWTFGLTFHLISFNLHQYISFFIFF